MARVIGGLALLVLSASLASSQTQTVVIQGPDGAVGTATFGVDIAFPAGIVAVPDAPGQTQGQAPGTAPGVTPPRDAQTQRTGTSRIRGHVVAADTGLPLRQATVRVTGAAIREPRMASTDVEGRYDIGELPAGTYSANASKSAFVGVSYGQARLGEMGPGKPIALGDNQAVDKIDFALLRGGVITGRVVDEYGEPVPNAMVQAVQNRFVGGQQRLMPNGPGMTTPDTGEYRLWGLTPGQYFVSVTVRGNIMAMPGSDTGSGYAPTYYPSVPSLTDAQPVVVAAGQIAGGVDIALTPTRTAKISGTAIDSRGQPVRTGMVMAMRRAGMMTGTTAGGPIRQDGTFTIAGVPPGDYVLRGNLPPSEPGMPPETLTATATVNGGDVSGIVLAPLQPATLTGRITLDPPDSSVQPAMIRVTASPKNPEPMLVMIQTGPGIVKDDFTFVMKASPGRMVIRAGFGGPGMAPPADAGQWSLKAVRYDTRDITDDGLDLESGGAAGDIEIVLTNRVQAVTGRILDARGTATTEATALVFSQNKERWSGPGRYTSMARPDPKGTYTVRGLAPGDYFAVAVDAVDSARLGGDPAYFEELSRDAVRFSLGEGETRSADLTLVVSR